MCENKFANKTGLKNHIRLVHLPVELRPFNCDICPDAKSFSTKKKLSSHMMLKHVSSDQKIHACTICDRK